MSQSRTLRDDVARQVREYQVPGVETPFHGVAFDARRLVVASGSYLVRLEPETGRVVDRLETFPALGGIAYDGRYLWQQSQGRFQQLQVRTGFVVRAITLDFEDITGLECIDDDLLVLHSGGRVLARVAMIDRANSVEVVLASEQNIGLPLRGLAWCGEELWSSTEGGLVCIEPASAQIRARLALPRAVNVRDLAGDDKGGLWCVDGDSHTVHVFACPDPRDGDGPSFFNAAPRWRRRWPRTVSRDLADTRGTVTDDGRGSRVRPSSVDADAAETIESAVGATFRRILVPIDFSADSKRVLATALTLKRVLGSEVHLLHLVEQGGNDEFLAGIGGDPLTPRELIDDAQARLLRYVDNVFPGRVSDVSVVAHVGADMVRGIEHAAKEVDATLVLLARRPRVSWLRSDIERIMRDLGGAVMVICAEPKQRR